MTQKELLMTYIINNRDQLAAEAEQIRQNLRYCDVDPVDCLEYMLAKERLSYFNVVAKHLESLMKISDPEADKYKYISVDYKFIDEVRRNAKRKGIDENGKKD